MSARGEREAGAVGAETERPHHGPEQRQAEGRHENADTGQQEQRGRLDRHASLSLKIGVARPRRLRRQEETGVSTVSDTRVPSAKGPCFRGEP